MFAFDSIFSRACYPCAAAKRLPTQSPSRSPAKSTLANAEICAYTPALATFSLSRGEDKAFDILFAIYHYCLVESEQSYQDWRHPTKKIGPPIITISNALDEGGFQPECGFNAVSDQDTESDRSYASTFLSFDSDISSLMSSSSEESLGDSPVAFSDFAHAKFTGSRVVYVAPAIPPHISVLCHKECATPTAPYVVDDLDMFENYDARYLTPRARKVAERRSNNIQKMARAITRELNSIPPLKPHEHPAPRSCRSPAVLKDLGHLSPLRKCLTEDVE